MTRLIRYRQGGFILLLCWPFCVMSHPHNWIDVNSKFLVNEVGELTQIKQVWMFDAFFSMTTQADIKNEYSDESLGLSEYADQFVNNLAEYQYFSNLRVNDKPIALGKPKKYQLSFNKNTDPITLILEMHFDLEVNQPILNKSLEWRVYDPTFYIAMSQPDEDSFEVQSATELQCRKSLLAPKPSNELISYAQSLDMSQKDTFGLGVNFAESALIYCE